MRVRLFALRHELMEAVLAASAADGAIGLTDLTANCFNLQRRLRLKPWGTW